MLRRHSQLEIGFAVNRRCFNVGTTSVTARGKQNHIGRNHFSISNKNNVALSDIFPFDWMEGYGGGSTVGEGNNNVVRRDSVLGGFISRHIVPSIFDTNVNHFVVHRAGHRIRYGSCVGGLVFHNETSEGIRLVVASVPFLVSDAFTEQTDRNETRDRTPSGQWIKGGLEQLWIACTNPHDESHDQKVHVSKFAELVFDGLSLMVGE